jgi:hypothetical protein
MNSDINRGLAVVQNQLKELDAISKQTMVDLNTVAGTERVATWKARTVALLSDALGQTEGQRFAGIQPGPSFTNDLAEEFSDLIEAYRAPLAALAKRLAQTAPPSAGN